MDNEGTRSWEPACPAGDVGWSRPKGLTLRGIPVAIYNVDDTLYATHDVCTHAYALLSDGFQEGHVIECPLHGALYDVRDGKCMAVGACDLQTYRVKVEDGQVLVELPA